MSGRALVTVRVARGGERQQAAIGAWLADLGACSADDRTGSAGSECLAVIAEGAFAELSAPRGTIVHRLVAGCVCCVGEVPLRVTLTRVLREHRPAQLLLVLASDEHLARVLDMLGCDPFVDLLKVNTL